MLSRRRFFGEVCENDDADRNGFWRGSPRIAHLFSFQLVINPNPQCKYAKATRI